MDEGAQTLHIAPEEQHRDQSLSRCAGGEGGEGTKRIFFYHAYFQINSL